MRAEWFLPGVLILALYSTTAVAEARQQTCEQATVCTGISGRLERLDCYDTLFGGGRVRLEDNPVLQLPRGWQRAMDSEQGLGTGRFTLHYNDPEQPAAGLWLTATALPDGEQPEQSRPVLMLSCLDGISRVELALPIASSAARATVTVQGRTTNTQQWLSDDSGQLFRSGQGLPAIRLMRVLLSASEVELRTLVTELDGLRFDTTGLASSLAPMRVVCQW